MTHGMLYIHQGKNLSKDSTINDFCWALLPLAKVVPAQPIHQNALFQILQMVLQDAPEGVVWMVVYDLRVLMQCLGAGISHIFGFTCFDVRQVVSNMYTCVDLCHLHCGSILIASGLWEKCGGSPAHWMWQTGQFGSESSRRSSSFSKPCNPLTMNMMLGKLGE